MALRYNEQKKKVNEIGRIILKSGITGNTVFIIIIIPFIVI